MKHYFFDLDGTLTDPGLGITNSVQKALLAYGIYEEDRRKLYPFIGPPLADSFVQYYGFSQEQAREAITHFRAYFSVHGIFENELYEGIPSLLKEMKEAGKKIYLATSKPEEFAVRILEHFQLLDFFDQVFGATMDEKGRVEKLDVLSFALKQSGADPKDSFMIGDRKYDMEAGKKLGLSTIGVLYGYGGKEELEKARADFICENVSELKEILLK